MRIAVHDDRLTLLRPDAAIDVGRVSGGRFGPDAAAVYDDWEAFLEWAAQVEVDAADAPPGAPGSVGAPSPRPRQVFAIGLNYRTHAEEAGLALPEHPPTFTKFPSCITGPDGPIVLPPGGTVDWEVELVAVIGRTAHQVAEADAWAHVAGLTIGQDLSERQMQTAGPAPQFSLGKSYPGFGPTGPVLVTPEELHDPDDLALECMVNGETVQKDRTSSLHFAIPELVARLSAVCTLHPGDLVFTGTPSGVGHVRTPRTYLQPGDVVTSRIEGIGEMSQTCVAP